MRSLDRKLIRDLGQLKGQVLTICLVVASGVAVFIAMQTAYRSILLTKDAYYASHRFADIFAYARRVPDSIEPQIRDIPGVAQVQTRLLSRVRIPLTGSDHAATGQIVSLPDHGRPALNDVFIRVGRLPEPGRNDECLLLESFAQSHHLAPGDALSVVLNGRIRELRVVGLALSPEYVFAFGGDVMSYEPGSFAVFWMRKAAIEAGFQLQGAFNNVVLRLQGGASKDEVIDHLDTILEPFGGFGAFGRDKQPSHHFVTSELDGLRMQTIIIPFIFLSVAAFLVNVVLARLVQLQRSQIAALKALGYSDSSVGLHYLKLVTLIIGIGSVLGVALGTWLGGLLMGIYKDYFLFPSFEHRLDPEVLLIAVLISLVSAVAGAAFSLRGIIRLPPAAAMQPEAPASYKTSSLDWLTSWMGVLARMVFRELRRRPGRLLLSTMGLSMAVAILVIGRFAIDSIDYLMDVQFERAMREDVSVGFREPLPARVVDSLRAMPGVHQAEGLRTVPVKLTKGAAARELVINGMPVDGSLRVLLNQQGEKVRIPMGGLLLTDLLAEKMGVVAGDLVELQPQQGERRKRQVLVAGTVSDMLGMQGYMQLDALRELMGEDPMVSTVLLSVDPGALPELRRRLYDMPAVALVQEPAAARRLFDEQQGGAMLAMTLVLVFFACVIAVGIVYNNARVALSMRSRDLASMRVIGFTRGEISMVLLGELTIQVLLAMPIGMYLGTLAGDALLSSDPENFRMPAVVSNLTYVFAGLVTAAAGLFSALLVRRKLDRLDLIGVLKTRE